MKTIAKYILKYKNAVLKWAEKNLTKKKFKQLKDAIVGGIKKVQDYCADNPDICKKIFWTIISNLL